MNELSSHNTGAGKGDFDRSPGWRDHYDEIDWGFFHNCQSAPEGFERVGPGRLRKRYGAGNSAGVSLAVEGVIEWRGRLGVDPAKAGEDRTVPALPPEGEACCGQCGCEGDN